MEKEEKILKALGNENKLYREIRNLNGIGVFNNMEVRRQRNNIFKTLGF